MTVEVIDMSAIALGRRLHPPSGTGQLLAWLALAVAAALVTALIVSAPADRAPVTRTTAPALAPDPPVAVIGTWLVEHRQLLFPGYDEPYVGRCPVGGGGPAEGLCSAPFEDLGDLQIHQVGVVATNWGADILLERTAAGWWVVDWSAWPMPETPGFRPVWSPQSSIAAWWEGRAEAAYGSGAVHVHGCAQALEVAGSGTGQPILCSSLVEDRGMQRIYASGLAGEPADVHLLVTRGADHRWTVDATAPARDEQGPAVPPW
jgi:hypothetical protein